MWERTTRSRLATGQEKKPNPINFRIRILLSMRQIYENKIIRRKRGSYRTTGVRLAYIPLALSVQDPSSESEEINREKINAK